MYRKCNALVAQSGGPTTVINASLAGVIAKALKENSIDCIYGVEHGIEGVLEERFIPLHRIFGGDEERLNQLKLTPSMFLGSCRYRLAYILENTVVYQRIFQILKKYHIRYFFYIGGNDSMDTVDKLSAYAKQNNMDIAIIGIPKTIDNDLVEVDHTPGFGSTAKYIASSILEISHDTYIYNTKTVLIVEIMGRNAGWLTASAALARNSYSEAPHLIYLPERAFSVSQFLQDLEEQFKYRQHVVVAVSEGIKDKSSQYVAARSNQVDEFGHATLSGVGKFLEGVVQRKVGCKVRSIELNVLQRCAMHLASLTDLEEAFKLGECGVEAALRGETAIMVGLYRTSNTPYQVEYKTIPVNLVANQEKKVPSDWITPRGNDVTIEMLDYLQPLIQGEPSICYEAGVPKYLDLKTSLQRKQIYQSYIYNYKSIIQ